VIDAKMAGLRRAPRRRRGGGRGLRRRHGRARHPARADRPLLR
jgi:hypothetical protein